MFSREITNKKAKEWDQRAQDYLGFDGAVLMEMAGYHVFEIIKKHSKKKSNIVIICGKGNNAGDAFVVARHLLIHQYKKITVVLCQHPKDFTKNTLNNYHILKKMGISIKTSDSLDFLLNDAEIIVDGLLGIGLHGPLRGSTVAIIQKINKTKEKKGLQIFAIDLPSGFFVKNKQIQGTCLKATHTITFLAPKKNMTNPYFLDYIGTLTIRDIGVSKNFLEK